MTLALMIYGIVLGSLLAGAAHFLDRGLRALGRPTRWIWGLAMAVSAGAPIFSRIFTRTASTAAKGGSLPADLLYEMVASGTRDARGISGLSVSLDQPLVLLWALSSSLILLALLWTSLRLYRTSKSWGRQHLGSQEVLVSNGLGPAVLGLFRPMIVLPSWALALPQDKLDMILLHEKEHQEARDPALLALGLLLAALAPWNPGLWWMARRLHLAVEGDCDGRVLAHGVPIRRYGDLLLEVASGARGLSMLAPALAEGGNTFLERRLLMIRSTVRKHRFGAAALATLASAGLLVLACETPTPPVPMEDDATLETPPPSADLAEAEEGYFLVRKSGSEVEYLGSVSPEQLELIQEDADNPTAGYLVRVKEPTGDLTEVKEQTPARIRLREVPGGTLEAAGPKPLIIVDGVIMSDPDAIENLDPDRIESIEVIKGDAALALYGERASGGVIQVTLKR